MAGKTIIFPMPEYWSYKDSKYIDDDIKEEVSEKSILVEAVIQLQIIKELKKLNETLSEMQKK